MADVVPLKPDTRRRSPPTRPALPEPRADAPTPAEDESADFVADRVDRRELRRLRRGDYPAEGRLDLHGVTVRGAADAISRFIQNSRHAQKRCVCIVHGRGLHSEKGRSALRGPVRDALKKMSGVLALATAPAADGGAGAVYVLLRRN